MQTILISLVSEQTIPNVRFIKEFIDEVDKFIFITTQEMLNKEKTEAQTKALNIPKSKFAQITVAEFNFDKIEKTLQNANFSQKNTYLLNITGGTKPMAIVTMTHFSDFPNAKIYYVPIGNSTYRQVFPKIKTPVFQFKKSLTLEEYLKAYNLKIISQVKKHSRNLAHAQKMLNRFVETGGDIKKIDKLQHLDKMSAEDRAYYNGGWFEEYIYAKLKEKFKLNDTQIAYNVKLKLKDTENEYDAVFVYQDSIYIVECKAYNNKAVNTKIERDLYKLGAIDDYFGINANSILITTANIRGKALFERAISLKVQLFHKKDLIDDKFLDDLK